MPEAGTQDLAARSLYFAGVRYPGSLSEELVLRIWQSKSASQALTVGSGTRDLGARDPVTIDVAPTCLGSRVGVIENIKRLPLHVKRIKMMLM